MEQLAGCQVLAFCGIGNPAAFFASLEHLGAQLVATRAWPDHHVYSADDIDWLNRWQPQQVGAKLVCTVKDWVKIQESRIGQRDLWALAIELQFLNGQPALEQELQSVADRAAGRQGPTDPPSN